jgi:solute:Na+ symporter, SSS family
MTALDWALVIGINLAIVLYGVFFVKGRGSSFDWFLASQSLPWWAIGLSAFGTAVDIGDYTAVAGGSYRFGVSQLAQWWLGIAVGWFVVSFFVIIPAYRSGVFTNAEWLEFRFGPASRVLAVLINTISRANVTGNMYFSIFLVLSIIGGVGDTVAWAIVIAVAVLTVLYVVTGGLRSDVITDCLQAGFMILASIILFAAVWSAVGGWSGAEQKLAAIDPTLPGTLLHVGGYSPGGVPAVVVVISFIVTLTMYVTINQYEWIRFLGSRSEWDMKMGAVVASVCTAVCVFFNLVMGPFGRVDFPNLTVVDQVYPLLVTKYLAPGLIGLVVAGMMAAAFSTFDSIGVGISSLWVRDVYARFINRTADDAHYTFVGRLLVPFILVLGFAFAPFLGGGMLAFYLRLAGAIQVPLMTTILMGALTTVRREAGIWGLLAGLGYGLFAIAADMQAWPIPPIITNTWWAFIWNIIIPAGVMIIVSKVMDAQRGPAPESDFLGLVYSRSGKVEEGSASIINRRLAAIGGTWLEKTLDEFRARPQYPFPVPSTGLPLYMRPGVLAIGYLVIFAFLLFVVLW